MRCIGRGGFRNARWWTTEENNNSGGNEGNRSSASGRLLIASAANRFPLHESEGLVAGMVHVSYLYPEGNKAE